MTDAEDLIATLALEPIELNLFRGVSPNEGFPRIFGGLVIAQALLAAYETVEDRVCHSLHAYFIRPGDVNIPVLYEVDRSRDGGTFTTRRVIAIQNGKQIFNLAASFQVAEDGLEHQSPMPEHPDPESVKTELDQLLAKFGDKLPEKMKEQMKRPRPIDLRWPDPQNMFKPVPKPPRKQVWMRAKAPIGPEVKLQQACLAYASDMAFMETALRVHGLTWQTPGLQSASLDHAMWFHRPVDFNDWLLFDQDCPSTSQGRGFIRGEMYTQDGRLAASVAQECLMRVKV
ncbi:acyl-CoA thioesterase II [Caulobacter sp. NIBR1757]|uniref:acyl-CoA thioesterase n=1 Tax=Caulobacter sp. NIBR1757 TaxID=3016000 RepID=UPI0022F118A4|nr:acyl-CoA thioesterase II [Caulobacter sp. NIBR1757]WGM38483.1 Acyl-CoA thioesterase 2 [Caulobacter sp. NIBR1757]